MTALTIADRLHCCSPWWSAAATKALTIPCLCGAPQLFFLDTLCAVHRQHIGGLAVQRRVLCDMSGSYAGGKKWAELNEEFLKEAGGSQAPLRAHFAAAKMQALATEDKIPAADSLASVDLKVVKHSLSECVEVYEWLKNTAVADQAAKQFFEKAQAEFEWSSIFNGAKRLPLPEDDLCSRLRALATTDQQPSE
jgi:hypothetical protein